MTKTNKDESPLPSYPFMDSTTFATTNFGRHWLIEEVLLSGQPGVIAGPQKCLKTGLALDLAVSLSAAKSFLGHFTVPNPVRVAFLSGERDEDTLREKARAICKSKKIKLPETDVRWAFDLPQLSRQDDLDHLEEFLTKEQVKVVIFDSLFGCLLPAGSSPPETGLYETGPLLQQAGRVCLRAGATPIFVYHFAKVSGRKNTLHRPFGLDFRGFQTGAGAYQRGYEQCIPASASCGTGGRHPRSVGHVTTPEGGRDP